MANKTIIYDNKKFDINYNIINNDKKNIILFLHGWGSNKEIMSSAFSLYLKDFKHIYIDMPGFGKSSNDYILNTYDYTNIIDIFLKTILDKPLFENSNKTNIIDNPFIIVGHSFGGKIATLLNPKLLVLLSSSGILEKKPIFVKLKIFVVKILKIFGLDLFSKLFRSKDVINMSENMYQTFKNVVNEDFSYSFSSYENRALIFTAIQDKAVSIKSSKKISELINNSKLYFYEGDHYFFIKQSKYISKQIENDIF